ncbi:MAG: diaminopimelate epimerase [Chromatiales bacterium]|jgi:diaminopimelate epimerase
MDLSFAKMHGLGNDFVVFDAIGQSVNLSAEQIRFIANRRFGVGCDQVLLVEPPRTTDTDFYYRIFNADGGEVEQCGNGARCFARFVRDRGLSDKTVLDVGTRAGTIRLYLEEDGQVRVNMGVPSLEPAAIPFSAPERAVTYTVDVEGRETVISALSMGNPHAVLRVPSVDEAPLDELGPKLEGHTRFPQRANVEFMAVRERDHIDLRVFERGAGETLACGTGACAAVVAGRLQGLLDERVRVSLPGGDLMIAWAGEGEPVWMTGPSREVFQGRIPL